MCIEVRNRLLNAAVSYTATLKGKQRDRALFDYLAGAVEGLRGTDYDMGECPAWLWIIGVRGGSRLREIENMLHADE